MFGRQSSARGYQRRRPLPNPVINHPAISDGRVAPFVHRLNNRNAADVRTAKNLRPVGLEPGPGFAQETTSVRQINNP
jgi:hypothetical protein